MADGGIDSDRNLIEGPRRGNAEALNLYFF
jgi:hypothetical protein